MLPADSPTSTFPLYYQTELPILVFLIWAAPLDYVGLTPGTYVYWRLESEIVCIFRARLTPDAARAVEGFAVADD